MLSNPFLAVMVGEEKIGYFVQCTEETVNSHGSTNDWDVIYYIPIQWDYQWVKKNDPFVVLYNSHTIINDAKTIFSGKRDGMIEEFLLVKKGSEICNDFLLIKDLRKEDYEKIFYALREEHYWDGKPSQMFLKEIGDFTAPYRVKYISDVNQKRFALLEGTTTYSIWEEGVFKCYINLDESDHWVTEYNFWKDVDQKLAEKPEEAPAEEYIAKPRRVRRRRSE